MKERDVASQEQQEEYTPAIRENQGQGGAGQELLIHDHGELPDGSRSVCRFDVRKEHLACGNRQPQGRREN